MSFAHSVARQNAQAGGEKRGEGGKEEWRKKRKNLPEPLIKSALYPFFIRVLQRPPGGTPSEEERKRGEKRKKKFPEPFLRHGVAPAVALTAVCTRERERKKEGGKKYIYPFRTRSAAPRSRRP